VNASQPTLPLVAVLTISDRSATGNQKDRSGPELADALSKHLQWDCIAKKTVADEPDQIRAQLCRWADHDGIQLILTTGGTGFSERDVTPEATLLVIHRQAPGLVEAIRAASLSITPYAMLSRAVAGIRNKCLIINLPGNPKAVREALAVLAPVLPHALELITGNTVSNVHSRHP